MSLQIEKQIRPGLPRVGVPPYRQIHAHSTGNKRSTAQNEADYHMRRPVDSGFFSHVVGNGRIIQTGPVNQGAYDVGGGWNAEGYAHVELIESHRTQEEFLLDYRLYVNLLRQLAQEAGLPLALDGAAVAVDGTATGIVTHAYCTAHQPNNHSDHVDPYPYLASRGISKEQFAHDLEVGFETEEKKAEEEQMDYVIRSKSGKQGYVGVINGIVFGIGAIDTVHTLEKAGAKHISIDDGDFNRLLDSQKQDDELLLKELRAINASLKDLVQKK